MCIWKDILGDTSHHHVDSCRLLNQSTILRVGLPPLLILMLPPLNVLFNILENRMQADFAAKVQGRTFAVFICQYAKEEEWVCVCGGGGCRDVNGFPNSSAEELKWP